jgi:uncharacterized protein with HEPN domain
MDKTGKYLFDIQYAIALIEQFMAAITDFNAYQSDIKTQSAVERQLAIIGEAVNKLRTECPEVTLSHTQQMINFRNRIIHSYDNIDAAIVWAILKQHLPVLKKEVEGLM